MLDACQLWLHLRVGGVGEGREQGSAWVWKKPENAAREASHPSGASHPAALTGRFVRHRSAFRF